MLTIPGTNEAYRDFEFNPDPVNPRLLYKRASGELRVPSLVTKSRDLPAQKAVSEGTGEHAGHLIATRFGAPGDARNLSLQNPNMNTYTPKKYQEALAGKGGSWLQLENHWANILEAGLRDGRILRIKVHVEDSLHANSSRPYKRDVKWWLKEGFNDWVLQPDNVIYGNFASPQGKAAGGK